MCAGVYCAVGAFGVGAGVYCAVSAIEVLPVFRCAVYATELLLVFHCAVGVVCTCSVGANGWVHSQLYRL